MSMNDGCLKEPMKLLNDSIDFLYGMEIGIVIAELKHNHGQSVRIPVAYSANIEQLKLVAEFYDLEMIALPTQCTGFCSLTFIPKTKQPIKQTPQLSIVK